MYEPDFLVRLTNGDPWLIETKGLVDMDVPRKDARARVWCEDATELTAGTDMPQHGRYAGIDQLTCEGHRGRSFEELVRHALAISGGLEGTANP